VHYIYYGTFTYIEECLHRGIVTWEGLIRNVEYLGMRMELKACLGRYYRRWLRPNSPSQEYSDLPRDDDDDSDDDSDSEVSYGSDRRGRSLSPFIPLTPPPE